MAVDEVGFVSGGVYTETYDSTSGSGNNVAALFVSYGLLDATVEAEDKAFGLRNRGNLIIFRELAFEPKKRGIRWR